MARRSDPNRLVSAGILRERVDALLAAYDALPEIQEMPFNAEAAFQWAMEQPRRR